MNAAESLRQMEARNELKVEALQGLVPDVHLNLTALQVRVESLVKRLIGANTYFEMDYESALADVLDDLLAKVGSVSEYRPTDGTER